MRRPVVFCDFDGTITMSDNIVAIMRHFDPPGWRELVDGVVDGSLSIREGVGRMFELLPASRKDEVAQYVFDTAGIRAGFAELLDYCKTHGIEFLVTSGGIDFFLLPLLEPFPIPRENIYCNASDFTGERIRIVWPNRCDEHCTNDCGMCKTTVIRRYPKEDYFRILIGDSVTDFEGAKLADLVFARSHLIAKCEELGVEYVPYETFHDVIRHLHTLEQGGVTP
ncbi:2-hydroxy-3-keto-5-methylthiopentenyl-1-phosphate phosphatase [Paenibacillus flagellatus]|uniref:2-hydroxy-3-keto-5-methylthiopentenyl-1-phosphate phosphatase n=1 Tax=Paenibacillus flagellatus TaxID=2211139 RepID=A0A2V5K7R3_9BACL|nr:2-hydroxy-3-keto-5-methylthiopentenyl-1-phosphate phosphatase [Paenibacillus flagellatus]PYI54862.1 2-hydroxy-3-keto-5-methylthiopentenyl-1-phosphate phosphatase [Paenibacillus flagellatus]